MDDTLLSADQLAKRLGVKPETVKTWMRKGLIPASRLSAKVIRFDLDKVVASLQNRHAEKEVAQ